jgi:ribosomal protein S18 acetylase RimI-like enzyme
MKIEQTTTPDQQDISFLMRKIDEEIPDFGKTQPFAFFIRDKDRNIIAGCNAFVVFGVIYLDQLWIRTDLRRQGLGTRLMESVHEYGKNIGCTMVTLTTMDFQGAVKFYEKLGYIIDFKRQGYARNSSCIFLKKELHR